MSATKSRIKVWIKEGLSLKMGYLLSVCDTFDSENYPVYCKDRQVMLDKVASFDFVMMQRVDEVYLLEEPQCWVDSENPEMIRHDLKQPGTITATVVFTTPGYEQAIGRVKRKNENGEYS